VILLARKGKVLLNYVITAPKEAVEEGKRIFASHGPWMEETHPREGDQALINYDVAIAPERSNPMDANSEPTGRTVFVLTEVYESEAGVQHHFQLADSWDDFGALQAWLGRCEVAGFPAGGIVNSL
jgi:hypothetical protein